MRFHKASAALLILVGLLASLSGAAEKRFKSSLSIGVDPRIELLGVVQCLARQSNAGPLPEGFSDLSAHFDKFRDHDAVKSYRGTLKSGGDEGLALALLGVSAPPELKFERNLGSLSPDFLQGIGGVDFFYRFLRELRSFATSSEFDKFYQAHLKDYQEIDRQVRRQIGIHDYMGMLEDYLKADLQSRFTLVLSVLYSPGPKNSFIFPYPFRDFHIPVSGPYDVLTILDPLRTTPRPIYFEPGAPPLRNIWNELVYVPLEQAHSDFGEELESYVALYASVKKDCLPTWTSCALHLMHAAVVRRLSKRLFKTEYPFSPGELGLYERALSRRLLEYESRPDLYPRFHDFYPRLMDVFRQFALERGLPIKQSTARTAAPSRQSSDDLRALVKSNPESPPYRASLAALLHEQGLFEESLNEFAAAIRLAESGRPVSPSFVSDVLSSRASLLFRMGRFDESRRDLETALKRAPAGWPRRKATEEQIESLPK